MRSLSLLGVVIALAACGKDNTGTDVDANTNGSGDGSTGGETPAFTVVSKDVTLQPNEEVTYCYYFHTPNTAQVVVKKWTSDMEIGSHHMIMFFGSANQPADGTLSTNSCGAGGMGLSVPVWVYASQTPHGELPMPTDDGAGKPLGMNVPANQPAYFQMHYLNVSDQVRTVHVTLNAFAYPAGTQYTPTAAYITYNNSLNIPGDAVMFPQSQTCNVPTGAKFWTVSTHAHKQAVKTELLDGSTSIFSSMEWEHPGAKTWMTTPFYTFTSGKMTYTCTYTNNGTNAGNIIHSGPSAQFNEMCMGTGYFFPATAAKFCVDGQGPF
jgi:hypothetical protein